MNTYSLSTFSHSNSLMPITTRPSAVMARSAGSWIWDEAGNKYLDFLQGWAVNCLGHCPPEVVRTLTQQAQRLITPSPALHNRPQLELADKLVELTGMTAAHFTNSGAEANEVALKLARKWGRLYKNGAYGVITTTNAFHGRTLATMAASGKPGWDTLFPPYPDGFEKVTFGCIDSMEKAINEDTVALMVEPVQGEAGVVIPPLGYLADLRALADTHNLLLIFDEIQTGIGRTGTFVVAEQEDVRPDIITLGKGLGSGLPLACALSNKRANCFSQGDQGGTYNGNPLVTAVGKTVVDAVAEPEFLQQVNERARYLHGKLSDLKQQFDMVEIRSAGLLAAVELAKPTAAEVVDAAFALGLLVNAPRPNVLRFMPSLRVTEAELDLFALRLRAALEGCDS